MQRRNFLKTAAMAAAVTTTLDVADLFAAVPSTTPQDGIARRTLGRTGAEVSIVGIGGYHLGKSGVSEDDATRIVRTALDSGINFLDNCWDYNNGVSEQRMGKALADGYRQKAFLMTKIDGRTPSAAKQQLEQSLQRLKTDHIDLVQIHEVIRMTDPEQAFQPGYIVDVLKQAQKAGKIRYIGFTGHKSPEIHLHMIETATKHGFTFDTVQMPLNVMDAHYDSFQHKVLPAARKLNMGIIGMKPMGDNFILQSNTVTAVECLHYAMSLPVSLTVTGCDSMKILDQALTVARQFKPLDQAQMAALLQKTAPVATVGKFELYKTSNHFDGTIHNPKLLG
ncbi:MAG: aldo/keto reductase [Acidobacteriaceae bacterium]